MAVGKKVPEVPLHRDCMKADGRRCIDEYTRPFLLADA